VAQCVDEHDADTLATLATLESVSSWARVVSGHSRLHSHCCSAAFIIVSHLAPAKWTRHATWLEIPWAQKWSIGQK